MGQYESTQSLENGDDLSIEDRTKMKQWEQIVENRLSKKDIRRYRKIWLEMFGPTQDMDKVGFRKWIKAIGIFPDLPDDAPIDHLFRSYDRNRDGKISFDEFILYLSITAPTQKNQDPQKIIEVTFLLYDSDGDGILTAQELRNGMKDTFRLLGHDVDSSKFQEIINNRVKQLMDFADTNCDGEITLDEVKAAVQKHPQLLLIF